MRSTVMSERPQPLQATVNSRLDASRMDHLFGGVRVPEVPAQVADVARRRNPECLRGGADGELLAGNAPKLPLVLAVRWRRLLRESSGAEVREGKERLLGLLVGQVMKGTGGEGARGWWGSCCGKALAR